MSEPQRLYRYFFDECNYEGVEITEPAPGYVRIEWIAMGTGIWRVPSVTSWAGKIEVFYHPKIGPQHVHVVVPRNANQSIVWGMA